MDGHLDSVGYYLDLDGYVRCLDLPFGVTPCSIDGHIFIEFRLNLGDAEAGPEFRFFGQVDGFPWHEIYINGSEEYSFAPMGLQDVFNLCPSSCYPSGEGEDDGEEIFDSDGWREVSDSWK